MEEISLDEHEAELRRSFASDAPERELANWATSNLAVVIDHCPKMSSMPEPDDTVAWRYLAILLIGVRMLRAARGGMAVLACGYEPEAQALERVLWELHTHLTVVHQDPTGVKARQWVKGKAGKGITKLMNEHSPDGFYKALSYHAHGDPRSVWDGLAVGTASDFTIVWGPERRPKKARAMLIAFAGVCRDAATVLALEARVQMPGQAELDAALGLSFEQLEALRGPT